jgi:hypothetical protein
MGQAAINRKKQERSTERMQEAGIDPAQYAREDKNIPNFPSGGESTIFFQRVPEDYIKRHATDKFSVSGRQRMSYIERMDLPSYSPDSVKVLYGPEAFQQAKKLLVNLVKGDTDALADMADKAFKRGGLVMNKKLGGFVSNERSYYEDDIQNRLALPIMKPWSKRIELQPLPMGTAKLMAGGNHRRMR